MWTEGHESQLIDAVRGKLDHLNVLWDQISMEGPMREARTELVFTHLQDVLDDIVSFQPRTHVRIP